MRVALIRSPAAAAKSASMEWISAAARSASMAAIAAWSSRPAAPASSSTRYDNVCSAFNSPTWQIDDRMTVPKVSAKKRRASEPPITSEMVER